MEGWCGPRRHLADVGNAPRRGAPTIFTHTAPLSKGSTMSTVITGASGHLGRLVVDQLLAAGTPPSQIVDNDLADGA
jgi:hypothetical protein